MDIISFDIDYAACFLGGLVGGSIGLIQGQSWGVFALMLTAVIYGLGVLRGKLRNQFGKVVCKNWKQFDQARRFELLASPITGLFLLAAMLTALCGRKITWRGIHYRIQDGGMIRIQGRNIDGKVWQEIGSKPEENKTIESRKAA